MSGVDRGDGGYRSGMAQTGPAAAAPETLAHDGRIPGRAGWRSHVAGLGIATIVFGLFLAGTPFLLDFASDAAAINVIACGLLAVFLGVLRLVGVRHRAVGYVQTALGIWLIASSAFIGEIPREVWTERCIGMIIFICGIVTVERMPRDSTAQVP
jgi:hypothetical protein